MKLSYFKDTDTLYIEFKADGAVETRELDENTFMDIDANQQIVALTIEHASHRTDVNELTLNGIAA